MNCRVCLKEISKEGKYKSYHDKCFRHVFGTIRIDPKLPFTRGEFKTDRARRNNKSFSISGVQPKLLISIQDDSLEVTEIGGTHILKVSPEEYPMASENEHLSMEIFRLIGLDTADCGLMELQDNELAYVAKRFDREGDHKIHQEDMMQAMGIAVEGNSKYDSKSYEDVANFLYAQTKSLAVVGEFFKRVVLNFLIANDDFHLKNISIRPDEIQSGGPCLTPVYDSLNTEVYDHYEQVTHELAMDLVNTETGTTEHHDTYGYHTILCFNEFAKRIQLNQKYVERFYESYEKYFERIIELVGSSYLSDEFKGKYKASLIERREKFFKPLGK